MDTEKKKLIIVSLRPTFPKPVTCVYICICAYMCVCKNVCTCWYTACVCMYVCVLSCTLDTDRLVWIFRASSKLLAVCVSVHMCVCVCVRERESTLD